jgi:hypothetical protein
MWESCVSSKCRMTYTVQAVDIYRLGGHPTIIYSRSVAGFLIRHTKKFKVKREAIKRLLFFSILAAGTQRHHSS